MTLLKKFTLIACLLWSGVAAAVSLGGISVGSLLGQPLQAEINLLSVTAAEQTELSAKLASPEQFKAAGIDYPYSLPLINFTVATRSSGETYIKLTSVQPINEPIVNLLLELNWSSGRLLREYNFQLASSATAPEKTTDNRVTASAPVIAPVVEAVAENATLPTSPAEETKAVAESTTAPIAAETVSPLLTTSSTATIKVKNGDNLTKIAQQYKPVDVSLERMLVALYRANTTAFDAKNMNRLRVGRILQLPENAQIVAVKQAEAMTEIHAQVVDWENYRQQLARANKQPVDSAAKQEAHGKIGSAVSDQAGAVKPNAKEVLKLSKSEMNQATSGTANVKSAEEDLLAKDQALKDAQARTAVLEKNIEDLKRLAELKSQAAASVAEPSVVNLASDDTSFKEEVTGNPIYLAGLIVVLLVVSTIFYVRPRREAVVEDVELAQPEIDTETVPTEVVQPPLAQTHVAENVMPTIHVESVNTAKNDIDFRNISLHLDEMGNKDVALTEAETKAANWHEVATKIDLAKAYQAMGEVAGMREILAEVMREGDDEQRQVAQKMLQSIG